MGRRTEVPFPQDRRIIQAGSGRRDPSWRRLDQEAEAMIVGGGGARGIGPRQARLAGVRQRRICHGNRHADPEEGQRKEGTHEGPFEGDSK